ncbi:MAG: Rieske 2Fe-2S domain-containing protein [Ktedonobacteraceae bacterium]
MTDQLPAHQEPDQSLDQITQRLDSLVQTFEQHPIIQVREEAMEMLGLIDALHRTGIQRLVETLRNQGTEVLDQVLQDPAVEMLLTLYDLMPPEPLEQVESVLEELGPSIASYGYTVEVLDVIDGVVQLWLSGSGNDVASSKQALLPEIEKTLREGFSGFRSIEMREPVKAPRSGSESFIPLQQVGPVVRRIKRPVFTAVAPVESLQPGTLKGVKVGELRILLCNLEGEVYAYRNACPGSVLPLEMGELTGHTLHCPWHNCLYDIRTGKRLDGGDGRLQVLPATIRDGMIQLALDVESVPMSLTQAPGKAGGG